MCDPRPITTKPRFLRSVCKICYVIALLISHPASNWGQEPDGSQPDLPKHAIWRFGDDENANANGIYRLHYSHDGKLLATRNRKNVVSIYDVTTRTRLCEIEGHENNWVETIDFSPDSKYFMTAAGSSEKVKIWNTQTGKLESEIDSDATAAYFNQSGTAIHLLGETHVEVYSWPGVQMTSQQRWKTGNEIRVGMSTDGRVVVSYRTLNRQIYQTQVFDLETKSKILLGGITGIPKSVAISSNRIWIAAAFHRDDKVRLWDMRDPHQKKYQLDRHDETVQSLSFSADDRFLVSSGWDEKVVAWDILTRQPLGQFDGHTEHVNATAISPLDWTFASGASGTTDTSVIIWNLDDVLHPVTPSRVKKSFDQIWTGLGANSLSVSLDATAQLIANPDEFLEVLDKRTGNADASQTLGTFESSIKLLNHPEWAVREQATDHLIKIRGKVDAELRLAMEQTTSPEVRYRISRILKKKITRPRIDVVDLRRWHRIVYALERINSQRAKAILSKIAAINPDVDVAQVAKAALHRNEMRDQLTR